MLQKCLCTLARFVRCRLFRSLWTLFIASVRVVILSFQFRAAPLILNVTSKTSHKINNVGSFLNDSLCLKLHLMPWLVMQPLYQQPQQAALNLTFFLIFTFCTRCIGPPLLFITLFWFIPWRLDLHLYSHIDYSALWKSLHCVELFFLCAATLPVWFLICVAKQWLPGKSLSYISHWFP